MTGGTMHDRREAIERLAEVQLDVGAYADSFANLSAVCKAIYDPPFGWTLGACATLRDKLVDLLGAAGTPESAESGASGGGDPDDTRERLEADALAYLERHVYVSIEDVKGWLDRQRDITHAEVNHDAGIAAHEAGKILRERIDELEDERDELGRANKRLAAERDELKRQLDTMRDVTREFRDERDELKAELRECDEQRVGYKAERDSLIAKLREIVGDGCSSG